MMKPTGRKMSKYERIVANILELLGIKFIREYRIGKFRIDFYLPEFKTALEVDGEHHFEEDAFIGANKEDKLYKRQKLDKEKELELEKQNIKLIRIPYYELKNPKQVAIKITKGLKKDGK